MEIRKKIVLMYFAIFSDFDVFLAADRYFSVVD